MHSRAILIRENIIYIYSPDLLQYKTCTSLSETVPVALPRLERVLDLSMMALLLGLFSTDLLANEISAVTLVMDILEQKKPYASYTGSVMMHYVTDAASLCLLTSHRTCASGSQTALSASYRSPGEVVQTR